jgi:cobalt-zinc-cadmium efflux system membrane fusion protein
VTSRFVVGSPIAGVVAERQVTVGQAVDATAQIFTIADLSELWVTVALYDRDIAAVRPGTPAAIRVQGSDIVFAGRVTALGAQVSETTRTLPVRIAVRNQPAAGTGGPPALRPGMFATVDLETSRKAGVVVVPLEALQSVDGTEVVFVETPLGEGAVFQRRPVTLGSRDDKVAEVVGGVTAGERVVVANAYLLKSEFEKARIGEGHAH